MTTDGSRIGAGLSALHGILLSFPIALFTGAVVSDIAYLKTFEDQWTNFSAWLITGALVFCGVVAAWALVALVLKLRSPQRNARAVFFAVLAALFVVGLVNAFKHSQDVAGVMAFSGLNAREIVR